jgi:flagellum-specific peptidoglycan hydrolase FlgJ
MGKMKWYATMEDNLQQPVLRKNTTQNRQRRQSALGHWIDNQPDQISLRNLIRHLIWRLRRHWLAFLFQANKYTLGAFRERAVLKLGTVVGLGYFLLFTDQRSDFFLPGQLSESMQLGPVETTLEDTDGPTAGRSLDWKVTAAPTVGTFKEPALPKLKNSGNDAAPISARQMKGDKTGQYISRFSKTAVQEMHKFGIPASISLAQGLVESRWPYGTTIISE